MPRNWLTIRECATRYRVSERTVWRMIADGLLTPARRAGDRRVYLRRREAAIAFQVKEMPR